MERDVPDVITGISRFGRLRKISTKLIDLPTHTYAKRKKRSPSHQLPDPFVDFRPETFKLLVSEETEGTDTSSSVATDTSSSVGDYDESDVKEPATQEKMCKRTKTIDKPSRRRARGQSRCTAYSLWAEDARLELLESEPDLSLASVPRRLIEMWEAVASTEKYNFKRKAALRNSRIRKNSMPPCEVLAPIETVWLPSNY